LHHPDIFCYICGEYTLKASTEPISDLVKRAYVGYPGVKLGDQDKPWAHIVCKTCTDRLRQWTNGKRRCLKFAVPVVWREQKNHFDGCYICTVNIIGINRNNHEKWSYADLPSARRPVPHSDLVPVPPFRELP
jgi:hypothetical protein